MPPKYQRVRKRARCSWATRIAAFLLFALATPGQASGVHATFYEMDVRCLPGESRIEGSARIGLREAGQASDTLGFWLHGELRATAVRADGVDLEVSQKRVYYTGDYSLIGNRVEVGLPRGRIPERAWRWSGADS